MRFNVPWLLFICCALVVGCTDSHASDVDAGSLSADADIEGADAADRPDGTFTAADGGGVADANVLHDGASALDSGEAPGGDAGSATNPIGTGCASDADCGESGACLTDVYGYVGGYCTARCESTADCGSGAVCLPGTGDTPYCYNECTVNEDCRSGYACGHWMGYPSACVPGCRGDAECGDGATCLDPGYGAPRCATAGVVTGDSCALDSDCGVSDHCASETATGFPSGACVRFGCDPATNSGCDTGSVCVNHPAYGPTCMRECADDAACRAGYECNASGHFCAPTCTSSSDCTDGRTCDPFSGLCYAP